jgi:hypothetical protein
MIMKMAFIGNIMLHTDDGRGFIVWDPPVCRRITVCKNHDNNEKLHQ